jgi:hypothetical protein
MLMFCFEYLMKLYPKDCQMCDKFVFGEIIEIQFKKYLNLQAPEFIHVLKCPEIGNG